MATLNPDFGPDGLPPLPHIQTDEIRQRVFTHRSFAARPTHIFEDSAADPAPDNEILEHLGDQVLGLVVTEILQSHYPYLRVGPSTKVRAMVVGNTTLAAISVRYRLADHLRLHPAQVVTLRASTNVQADVFESYVGGLYKDQGLAAVQHWLQRLFAPYIDAAYGIVRAQHGLAPLPAPAHAGHARGPPSPPPDAPAGHSVGHLGLFNQRLQQEGRSIEWIFADSVGEGTRATPVWVARALVGELGCVGTGRGNTKRAAKNEAAKEGLRRLGVVVDN